MYAALGKQDLTEGLICLAVMGALIMNPQEPLRWEGMPHYLEKIRRVFYQQTLLMPSAYNEVDEIIQDSLVMGSFFTPGSGPQVLCQQMLHIALLLSRYGHFNFVVQRLWSDFLHAVRLYWLHLDDLTTLELQYNNLTVIVLTVQLAGKLRSESYLRKSNP